MLDLVPAVAEESQDQVIPGLGKFRAGDGKLTTLLDELRETLSDLGVKNGVIDQDLLPGNAPKDGLCPWYSGALIALF